MNKIQFHPPLADAKSFPKPIINGLAAFKWLSLTPFKRKKAIFSGHYLFTLNGRNALALLAEKLALKSTETILLPAYHCPALVEPFIWQGVNIEFYHLNADLSVDLTDLASKINNTTRACLFVRYFGFELNIKAATALAKKQELTVIEDWAHCFFGSIGEADNGLVADFAISSCNKFFPTLDGGIIHAKKPLNFVLSKQPIKEEIKYFLHLHPHLCNFLSTIKNIVLPNAIAENNNEIPAFRYFNHQTKNINCCWFTQCFVKQSHHQKIIQARRQNYLYLLQNLIDLSVGKPLYPILPDATVPYVFPFVLSSKAYFKPIRQAAITIFRWEELVSTDCQTSQTYHQRLIQIPCHQSLTQKNLNYIINTIKNLT